MDNEYYYLHDLESRMEDFIIAENENGEFGWIPPRLHRRMAEAAFAVLKNSKELQHYLISENELKA